MPDSAMRRLCETMPPMPTASDFSITTRRLACDSTSCSSSLGKGRKEQIDAAPMAWPASRNSSMTSLMVPFTEPSATTMVFASSAR